MKSRHLGWFLLLAAAVGSVAPGAAAPPPRVLQIDLEQVIHPLTVEIVEQGLAQAERDGAVAVVIRLNTPGGLLSATNQLIQAILASPVPVITYVHPSGGRAASAGFMILMAGDVAAMAPGTNTGAAHPVPLGGGKMDPIMKQKVENDAAASVRSVTAKRGRNSELAEKAVLESKAFTDQEALAENLIDLVAVDVAALLAELDGQTIRRFNEDEETLNLTGASVYSYELSTRQSVLLPLIDPNLAFLLMILGLGGIYLEFTNPGLILPGVLGGIFVIIALMSLTLLPINWAGAALILLGLACFVLEAMVVSHGILTAGGVAAMTLGAVMLIDTGIPELSISWGTAATATLPFALITVFLLQLAVRSYRLKAVTGSEAMIGKMATAKTDIHKQGRVFLHGEWWNANSREPIEKGSEVRIVGIDGLMLSVEPAAPHDAEQG